MKYPDAGTGCFASQVIKNGEPVLYHYGKLDYKDMGHFAVNKVYGEDTKAF